MRTIDLGPCDALLHDGDPARCVVVLPGMRYSTQAPLLWFARETALQLGYSALEVLDALPEDEDRLEWAQDRAQRALDAAPAGENVVIGKSLASTAAGVVADHKLPAVWLTPLLGEPTVIAGLERASRPALLIGGTADDTWTPEALARNAVVEVMEIEGVDHSLQRARDPLASLEPLRAVIERIARFLHALGAG